MKRFTLMLTCLVVLGLSRVMAQEAPVLTIGEVTSYNSTAIVPVTVADFNEIRACDLKFVFNPSVAMLTNITVGDDVTLACNLAVNYSEASSGVVNLGWFVAEEPGDISLEDDDVLFNLHFTRVDYGTSAVSFLDDDDSYGCVFYDKNNLELTESGSNYINGSVTFATIPPVYTTIQDVKGCINSTVQVPVTVTGFNEVGSVSLVINFDPAVLTYVNVLNTSGIANFSKSNPSSGRIKITANDYTSDGASIPDNGILLTLVFTYNNGSTTNITFNHEYSTNCEYAGPSPWFPVIPDLPGNANFINGAVSPSDGYLVSASSNGPVCAGLTLQLDATEFSGMTYNWTGPNGFSSTERNPVRSLMTEADEGDYVLTVVDNLGCTVSYTVNVVVNPVPVFNIEFTPDEPVCGGSNVVFSVTGLSVGDFSYSWTFNDEPVVGNTSSVTISVPSDCDGTYTIQCTVTDNDNDCSTTASKTIDVGDFIAPGITLPVVDASYDNTEGECYRTLTLEATATDNCDSAPDLTYFIVDGENETPISYPYNFPVGTTTVKVVAADNCSQTSNKSFSVVVVDSEDPEITCPTVEASYNTDEDKCTSSLSFAATATDNCSYTIKYYIGTNEITFPYDFPIGTTTVKAVASDGATPANTDECTFDVVVVDNQPPEITCPTTGLTNNTDAGECNYTGTFTATATDNCSVSSIVYSIGGSAITFPYDFPVGTTTVKAVATDANGLTAECTFDVVVIDNQAPVITCPTTGLTNNTDAGECNYTGTFTATATDNCSVSSIVYSIGGSAITFPYDFPVGTTTVKAVATDANGLTAECTFDVVVIDNQAPVITCPTTGLTNNTDAGECNYTGTFTATATDNCSVSSIVYSIGGSAITFPYDFPVGTTTVKAVATDANGLTAECTFDVVVIDNQAPVITCPTTGLTNNTDAGECNYTGTFTATATDNCSVSSIVYSIGGSAITFPYDFPVGTTTVKAVATDANGLTAECTFDVLVLDNQDPSVSCVSDQTRNTDDGFCAYSAKGSEFDPSSYSDNCSVVSLGYVLSGATTGSGTTSLSGVVFEIGVTNVQWTVTDVADNTSFCSFTVTIRDAHAPSVSCVDNQVEETDLNSCTYEHSGIDWDATALDICPEDLTAAELERLAIIETFDNAWGYRTYTGPGSKKGFEWTVNEQSLTSCGENRMRAYFEPSTRDVYVLISSTLAGERFYSLIDGCYGIRGTGMPTAMMNVITSDNVYQAKSGSSTINIYDGDGNKRSDSNIQSDAQNMALAWIGNPFNRFSSLVGNVFSFTLVGMLNDAPNVHDRTKFEVDYNFRFIQSTASGVHNASLYYRVSGGTAQGRTLAEAKTDAISELEAAYATYNPNHYTPENWTALTNAKNAGIADVNTVSGSPHPVWVTLNQKKRSALKAMENIPLMGVPLPVSYVLAGATTGNGISLDGIEFNVGTTIVTWTAMDANGNTASCSYTVTVEDKQVPTANKGTIDNCYTTVALAEAAAIAATTNRNDNCTAPEELVVTASTTGTCEAVVTVRVTDKSSNFSEYTYYTRIDNQAPTATKGTIDACYTTVTLAEAAAIAATTNRNDNCTTPEELVVTASTTGTCEAVVTVRVTDACGLYSEYAYNTRIDNEAPTATQGTIDDCYATVALAEAAAIAATTNRNDNCTAPEELVVTASTTGTCEAVVTVRVTDACGLYSEYAYNTRIDNEAPTATQGTIDDCYATVALAEAAAIAATTNRNDNCTAPEELVVTASTTGTCEAVVTVRVTDACGLYSEYSYNTRIDNTIPVITLLGSSTVEICQNETYIDAGATASDNCDGDISASVVATGSVDTNVPGSYTLYYNVKDNCGNDAVQVTRSVTVLAKPSASILPDPAYMIVGGSVSLNGNPSGGSGTYSSHEWTGDGAAYLSSTSVVNPTFNGAPVGTYHLTYSVTDNAGCLANDVITVTVYGKLLYVNDGTMDGDEKWCTAIGNDSNPGTSNAPLLTISKAVSVAEPGSIIYVDAGTYTEQVLVQKDLTLLGAGEGESIIKAPASGRICAPGYMTETWTADDPDYVDYVIAAYPADPVSGDPISVKIRDFTIDADGQTRSCDIFAGVYFRKVKEEEIADAGLFNSGIKGFNASDQNTFGIFVLDGAQLTIGSNDISTAYTGVSVWGTDNLVDPVVTTSYNRVSGNIGISYSYINNPALADDVVNNTMYSCNIAISALDCDHLMIAHNEISATRFGVYSYGGGEGNTISDNTISGSNSAGPEIGINLLAVDQHVVEGNTVTGSGTSGTGISVTWITQGSSCSHQILSNVVSDFGTGMNIATANNLIEGNFISDCSGEGIFVSQTGNSILHNDITTCNIGVNCYGPATINYNKIYGNTLYGLQNVYDSEANPGEVDAKMNWWGDPSGPYRVADNPCGAGNRIYGIGTGGNYDSYADNNVLICDWYTNEGMTQLNGCTTAVFAVTGGGAYCSGGDGVAVGLAGSETGVNYTLVYGTTNVTTLAGTGSALDFGLQTQAGTYSVTATNTITGCILPMPSSVTITVNQYATITLSSVAGTDVQVLCLGDEIEQIAYDIEGMVDNASVSGLPAGLAANYSAGVLIIGGTPTETGSFTYTVDLTGTCATATATGTITVYDEFNPGVIASTGESICYGCDPIEIGSIENASGGNGTIEYKWQSSTDGTNYEDIANSNSATYDPSNLYQTTYFKRFAKDETCNPDFSASSGIWVVTISDEGDVWGTYRYYFGDVNVPLEGVKVTLLGVGNTYSTTTNAAGEYVFETVEPGTYTVTSSYDEPTEGAINSLDAGMVNSWQVGPQYEI
ncbi:MAG TPA: HYR domain-containing protein, partial [Prolixibacteraceae bacterium]|nr:HYR domain-containing protein [Prolixibacteraceae bacterium]